MIQDLRSLFTLNLLSEKQKKEVRFEVYNRFLIQIGIWLVAIMAIFSILLVPTFIFLLFQKGDLRENLEIEQKSQENARISEIESFMNDHNLLIETIKSAESGATRVSPFVSDIFGAAEGLVFIAELKYNLLQKDVSIRGRAEEIKKFLIFKDILDGLPYFSEKIISPPENVVKLKNVSFTLRGKLK